MDFLMNATPSVRPAQAPLDDQLSLLMSQVRKSPADTRLRIHLAQLCMLLGQWERSLGQLQAVALADAGSLPFAQAYREAIRCELQRARVFAGESSPATLGTPAPWFAWLAQALRHRAAGEHAAADALQSQAFEAAEPAAFRVDAAEAAWIADADSRIGPCVEAFLNGQYYWIPFEDIQRLELEAPTDLRDLVWLPARLVLTNGGAHPVLLPVRYPGSEASNEDALRRSALTVWSEAGDAGWTGLGQRMWASDLGEHAMLATRCIERIDSAALASGHA